MKLTLSTSMLRSNEACSEGMEEFKKLFGESAEVDWTPEKQIEILKTPLKQYIGWAFHMKLIPMWSMESADLRSANLQCADLQHADLRYADLQHANLQCADLQHADLQCANLQYASLWSANYDKDYLSKLGWQVSDTGIVTIVTRSQPS